MQAAVRFGDIEAARERIGPHIVRTPCAYSQALSERLGCKVWFKLENLQMTGAFKERGALNRLLLLDEAQRQAGVVAASAGNHAMGVAYHARRLGIAATIVMPEPTPLIKVTRTRAFGAEVVLYGANFDEAYAHALELAQQRKAFFLHPFDDPAVIAGQGTIGLEILEQNPYVDAVVAGVGGGGLVGGLAVALKETNPRIQVFGVETEAMPAMRASLDAGHPLDVPPGRTIAEGIAVRRVGDLTFDLVRRYVDDVVVVSEQHIADAILQLLEGEKTVAEGAGAAPLAGLIEGIDGLAGKRVVCVVSGGNIDVNMLSLIIERGLVAQGRRVRLDVTMPDRPGSLHDVTRIIAEQRANILEIHHDRTFSSGPIGDTLVELVLETRSAEHGTELVEALEAAGYAVADRTRAA